jgi:hypothetical protein
MVPRHQNMPYNSQHVTNTVLGSQLMYNACRQQQNSKLQSLQQITRAKQLSSQPIIQCCVHTFMLSGNANRHRSGKTHHHGLCQLSYRHMSMLPACLVTHQKSSLPNRQTCVLLLLLLSLLQPIADT